MQGKQTGFTLIELIVAISVVAILSAVVLANMNDGRAQARDAERQADLRTLQSALELYRQAHGRYPVGCNGALTWSGQLDTDYECSDGSADYIRGHTSGVTFAPGFIPALPTDPKLNGDDSGYVYTTDADGKAYILKARLTVETEDVDYGHPFQSCDATNDVDSGVCDKLSSNNNSGNKPDWCQSNNPVFNTSYGVWGGYAEEQYGFIHTPNPGGHARAQESTEEVRCMMN